MTARASAGRAGEDYAAQKLTEQGYVIVARNYHSRYGEIDIIADGSDEQEAVDSLVALVESGFAE